ncbi:MAG TPA: fluoride efflux transporter CrcB [Steroidobacteraceae bacterium]|nr:fluoride efflux transporter CrcB [Steroidobacteraceae bacterium]
MNMILLVAIGGAFGSIARYLMASSIQTATGWQFPIGTVLVNILGCFLIGILYIVLVSRPDPRHDLRALLMVGVMGGFTTFSSFSLETVTLVMNGNYTGATLNVVLSVAACLVGTVLGISLGRIIQ